MDVDEDADAAVAVAVAVTVDAVSRVVVAGVVTDVVVTTAPCTQVEV